MAEGRFHRVGEGVTEEQAEMFHDLVPERADIDNVGLVRWEFQLEGRCISLPVIAAFVRDGDVMVALPVAILLDSSVMGGSNGEVAQSFKDFDKVKAPVGVIPAWPSGDGEVVQVDDVHYVDGKEVRRG